MLAKYSYSYEGPMSTDQTSSPSFRISFQKFLLSLKAFIFLVWIYSHIVLSSIASLPTLIDGFKYFKRAPDNSLFIFPVK